jgi:tetratricopeptide (TPR) repeat protein
MRNFAWRVKSALPLRAALRIALPAALLFGVVAAARAQDIAVSVSALETRLTGDPDNLQLGSQYRQAIIKLSAAGRSLEHYDRAIAFLEKLAADHPSAANAQLNFGFAYVDKIPAAGSITQVILANNALGAFTKSLELKRTWIALYTRGNSYLYWPVIFGRAPLGVADLEDAMQIQKTETKRSYHVRTYIALGDGYWKTSESDKARQMWSAGLKEFPSSAALRARLSAKTDDEIKPVLDETYDVTKRVDTSLEELFAQNDGTTQAKQ